MAKLFTKKKTRAAKKAKKPHLAAPPDATPLAACETSLGLLEVYVPAGAAAANAKRVKQRAVQKFGDGAGYVFVPPQLRNLAAWASRFSTRR